MATKKKASKQEAEKNTPSTGPTEMEQRVSFNFKDWFMGMIGELLPPGEEPVSIAVHPDMYGLAYRIMHDLPFAPSSNHVPGPVFITMIADREVSFVSTSGIPDRNTVSLISD